MTLGSARSASAAAFWSGVGPFQRIPLGLPSKGIFAIPAGRGSLLSLIGAVGVVFMVLSWHATSLMIPPNITTEHIKARVASVMATSWMLCSMLFDSILPRKYSLQSFLRIRR